MDDCNIFEIWEEYKSSLFGYIKKRVAHEDDAKDILQDVCAVVCTLTNNFCYEKLPLQINKNYWIWLKNKTISSLFKNKLCQTHDILQLFDFQIVGNLNFTNLIIL